MSYRSKRTLQALANRSSTTSEPLIPPTSATEEALAQPDLQPPPKLSATSLLASSPPVCPTPSIDASTLTEQQQHVRPTASASLSNVKTTGLYWPINTKTAAATCSPCCLYWPIDTKTAIATCCINANSKSAATGLTLSCWPSNANSKNAATTWPTCPVRCTCASTPTLKVHVQHIRAIGVSTAAFVGASKQTLQQPLVRPSQPPVHLPLLQSNSTSLPRVSSDHLGNEEVINGTIQPRDVMNYKKGEDTHGREPTHLEFLKEKHGKKGGGFIAATEG